MASYRKIKSSSVVVVVVVVSAQYVFVYLYERCIIAQALCVCNVVLCIPVSGIIVGLQLKLNVMWLSCRGTLVNARLHSILSISGEFNPIYDLFSVCSDVYLPTFLNSCM